MNHVYKLSVPAVCEQLRFNVNRANACSPRTLSPPLLLHIFAGEGPNCPHICASIIIQVCADAFAMRLQK